MTERARIDPSYLEKGTRVGAYEVVDKLGSGGFGCLWKVRRDGKLYALKIGRQRLSDLDARGVLEAISHDKKARRGRVPFILPAAVGRVEIHDDVSPAEVRRALKAMAKREA